MTIRGRVADAYTDEPLAGATLSVVTPGGDFISSLGVTDDSGRFQIGNPLLNYNKLLITYAGYNGTTVEPAILINGYFLDIPLFSGGVLPPVVVTPRKQSNGWLRLAALVGGLAVVAYLTRDTKKRSYAK